jgi:uncharacterized protein
LPRLCRVLILLPPSESKAAPRRGVPLELAALNFPTLGSTRDCLIQALVTLCQGDQQRAFATLGIGAGQADLIDLNAGLWTGSTARADRIYTGVLYDALGLTTLSSAGKRRANTRIAITSALFGLVRPADRIPAYRLSGDAALPGVGTVASVWRAALGPAVESAVGSGLLVDLRSTMYSAFWRPPSALAPHTATVRVLHEVNGQRKVVSHFNKATKGRIVRDLLEAGATPRTPLQLGATLADLGWLNQISETGRHGTQIDVVVEAI